MSKPRQPQIIVRREEICEKCGKTNLFRKTCGTRKKAPFGMAYAKCANCGHRAQIRICPDSGQNEAPAY